MGDYLLRIFYAESIQSSSDIVKSLINQAFFDQYFLEFFDDDVFISDTIKKQKHDLYIIGEKIGEKKGLSIIEAFSQEFPDKPFLYISGSTDCEEDLSAMKAGATDYLPIEEITPRLFERTIRYAISSKKMEAGLRNSQQFLIRLINYIPSPVFIKDKLMQFIMVNDSFCKLVEMPREDIIGNKEYEILTNLSPDDTDKTDVKVLNTGEMFKSEVNIKLKSREYTMLVIKALLNDFIGEDAIVGILTDITYQKIRQNKLLEHEKQLTLLNSSKDKLLSVIGHDLRGPIGLILQISDMITKEDTDMESMIQFVDDIKMQAIQSVDLLDNVLYWARSQQNELKIKPEKIQLKELADKIIHLFSRNASMKEIKLLSNIDKKLFVIADRDMLNIILRNLISNSLKFTEPRGKIEILGSEKSEVVEICIKDTGVGIDEETIKRIINKEGVKSTYGTENEKGSGLGLKLSRDFIELHHGNFNIESKLGKGTSIKFTLSKTL